MLRTALTVVAGLLVLAGCSSSSAAGADPEPAVAAPMADLGAPDDAAHGGAAGPGPLAFGASSTDPNGLTVTVTAPEVVTEPAAADPVQPWPTYVTVDVTLVNGSDEAYDPQGVFVSMASGSVAAEQVFAAADGLTGAPATSLAPGEQVVFPLAFGVTDPAGLSLEIAPDFDQPTVVYQG